MGFKDLSRIDLPREKLEKYGHSKLSNQELIAIILGSGIKGLNVLELSSKVAKLMENNKEITLALLQSIKGLGPVKAAQIYAALILGKRLTVDHAVELLSPEDIWKQCADFRESKREHFVAFYLDTQNRLLDRHIVSIGILNTSLVHPREVFEPAVKMSSASIIVVHNHPSGELEPSREDKEVTQRLKESGLLLGIKLVDHIIVTKNGYTSFLERELLY